MINASGQNQLIIAQELQTFSQAKFIESEFLVETKPNLHTSHISTIQKYTFDPIGADDKDFQRIKTLLGNTTKSLTDDQIKEIMSEIQFLAESWLDDFERSIFDGLTLQEILHERSGS